MSESHAVPPSSTEMPRHVRIGLLMDLYGNLLTDRQRDFVRLHYDEDMSFGEIAQNHGVSRQAVHDAVKHATRSLENYEKKLVLLGRGIPKLLERVGQSPLPSALEASDDMPSEGEGEALDLIGEALESPTFASTPLQRAHTASAPPQVADGGTAAALEAVAEGLRALRRRIQRSGGIIYDGDGMNTEVGRILARVEEMLPNSPSSDAKV